MEGLARRLGEIAETARREAETLEQRAEELLRRAERLRDVLGGVATDLEGGALPDLMPAIRDFRANANRETLEAGRKTAEALEQKLAEQESLLLARCRALCQDLLAELEAIYGSLREAGRSEPQDDEPREVPDEVEAVVTVISRTREQIASANERIEHAIEERNDDRLALLESIRGFDLAHLSPIDRGKADALIERLETHAPRAESDPPEQLSRLVGLLEESKLEKRVLFAPQMAVLKLHDSLKKQLASLNDDRLEAECGPVLDRVQALVDGLPAAITHWGFALDQLEEAQVAPECRGQERARPGGPPDERRRGDPRGTARLGISGNPRGARRARPTKPRPLAAAAAPAREGGDDPRWRRHWPAMR